MDGINYLLNNSFNQKLNNKSNYDFGNNKLNNLPNHSLPKNPFKNQKIEKMNKGSIVDNTTSYADAIRESRLKAKDTSLKLKKLRYDFKSISTKIMRSKTSANAKQVAQEARREVMKLKRQKNSGVDEEELQYAIKHAEAMERVAKKRARHLLEEEMIDASGGACIDSKEIDMDDTTDETTDEAINEAQISDDSEVTEVEMDPSDINIDGFIDSNTVLTNDLMEEMFDSMWEEMQELLEEAGMDSLLEGFSLGEEMDPSDIKMLKLKHRASEMKDIAKADSDYLKAMFKHYEDIKGNISIPVDSGMQTTGVDAFSPTINICV